MMKSVFSWCGAAALGAVLLLAGCGRYNSTKCVDNLKKISTAVTQYRDDNRGAMPSIAGLEKGNSIKKEEFCCPDTKQQYEMLIPELTRTTDPKFQNGKAPSEIPMIRCPKHGHVVYLDGHVEGKK